MLSPIGERSQHSPEKMQINYAIMRLFEAIFYHQTSLASIWALREAAIHVEMSAAKAV